MSRSSLIYFLKIDLEAIMHDIFGIRIGQVLAIFDIF